MSEKILIQDNTSTLKSSQEFVGLKSITSFLNLEIRFTPKRWSLKKKFSFYNDLSMLLSSGIDIKSALEIIIDNLKKKEDKKLLDDILKNVITGRTLSDSIQQSGKFSMYEYYTLKIGEQTGKLTKVLQDLSEYFSKKIDQNRKIINAFSYPVIVIATAIGAIAFMMQFIVPMFEDIFSRFDRELPGLTQFIINISSGFSTYLIFFIVVIIGLIITQRILKNNNTFRHLKSTTILKIPVFGPLVKTIHLSRFCLSMSLLISSRTPLIEVLNLMQKMTSFYPLQATLSPISKDILNGMSLYESMSKFKIYDQRMLSLIKVAEQVNKLDEIFEKLKVQYDAEIDHKSSMISNIMEPLIIVFIGLIVGLILISMYLPMFELSTSFEF